MIIIGAGGHAKEILDIISEEEIPVSFFDNISPDAPDKLFGKFEILKSKAAVLKSFQTDKRFALGIGNPTARFKVSELFRSWGGALTSVISTTAIIGSYNVVLKSGLNIMHRVIISNDVFIGEGTLVNASAIIHHDVVVGDYCEISPGAILLGDVKIGGFTSIGAGTLVLPKIHIGNHVIVGAGSVVTKDIEDNTTVVGIPAGPLLK